MVAVRQQKLKRPSRNTLIGQYEHRKKKNTNKPTTVGIVESCAFLCLYLKTDSLPIVFSENIIILIYVWAA